MISRKQARASSIKRPLGMSVHRYGSQFPSTNQTLMLRWMDGMEKKHHVTTLGLACVCVVTWLGERKKTFTELRRK